MDLLNKVMLVGNLTRDPEVRETGNGKSVAELGLAVDPPGGGKGRDDRSPPADPIFVDVVVWERTAENAAQYLRKGSQVLVEGRLQMDTWKDKESGQTRTKLKVSADRLRFMSGGSNRDRDERDTTRGRREPAGTR